MFSCILVTFYSEPVEAFLTSVFRVLEVFGYSSIAMFTSRDRAGEAGDVVGLARDLLPIDVNVYIYPDFPPPSDLEGFDGLAERVYRRVRDVLPKGIVVLAVYTGSRVEVSTAVLAVSRVREDSILVYTPFFWGPWSELFYPFTPKPLEPLVVLHPDVESVKGLARPLDSLILGAVAGDKWSRLLELAKPLSSLRRYTCREQLKMNLSYAYSTMLYPIDVKCSGIGVSIYVGGLERLSAEARDYCSARDVVEAVDSLGRGFLELREHSLVDEDITGAIELILKFSSVLLPAVDDCNYGCSNSRDLLLIDALETIENSERILIDTNILYSSLHTQLYEHSKP